MEAHNLTRISRIGKPKVIAASDGPPDHLHAHPDQAKQRPEGGDPA
jgi:hypothetical protein